MMQLTAAMIGMLGGPALQVLMVLAVERGARSLSFLQDMTNLSDKTLHQATRKLRTLGMVTEQTMNREKVYNLAGEIQQLPLSAEMIDEHVDNSVDNLEEMDENETSFVNSPKDVLNESMNESDSINQDDSLIDSCDFRKNSESQNLDRAPGRQDAVTAEMLSGFGFYGRGLKELLSIRGLTLREVRFHVADAPSLGAALARIKKRQAVPGSWEAEEVSGGAGGDRRYIEGPYSEFINH